MAKRLKKAEEPTPIERAKATRLEDAIDDYYNAVIDCRALQEALDALSAAIGGVAPADRKRASRALSRGLQRAKERADDAERDIFKAAGLPMLNPLRRADDTEPA